MAKYELSLYHADDGNFYYVWRPHFWYTAGLHRQWDEGASNVKPNLPPGLIMRHVNLAEVGGKRKRNLPCSRVEAGWWPFIGTTCVLPNLDGTTSTWIVVSYNSERYQPLKIRIKKR